MEYPLATSTFGMAVQEPNHIPTVDGRAGHGHEFFSQAGLAGVGHFANGLASIVLQSPGHLFDDGVGLVD